MKKENLTAKVIRTISVLIFVLGFLGSLVIGLMVGADAGSYSNESGSILKGSIIFYGIIVSAIVAILFWGFAELIDLSQKKCDLLEEIKKQNEK